MMAEANLKVTVEAFPTLKAWAKLHRKLDRVLNTYTEASRIALLKREVSQLSHEVQQLRGEIKRHEAGKL